MTKSDKLMDQLIIMRLDFYLRGHLKAEAERKRMGKVKWNNHINGIIARMANSPDSNLSQLAQMIKDDLKRRNNG